MTGSLRARRAALAAGAACAAAYVLYLALQPGTDHSVTVTSNLVQLVVPLVVTVPFALMAVRRTIGRERAAWLLFAGTALSWGLGQAVWTWYEVVDGTEAPFPSIADVGYLLAVPLLLVGVAIYPARLLALGRARAVVDAGLIASAGLFAAYGTFLSRIYELAEGDALARAIALAYPVGDLMIVCTAVALLARRIDGWRGAIGVVMLGTLALAVADSSFAYLVARGDYTDGVTDAGWAVGFLLIAYAATIRPSSTAEEAVPHRAPSVVEAALPVMPVAAACSVLAVRAVGGDGVGPFLGVCGLLMGLFVVARTVIIQIENARLTTDLADTVEALEARENELHHQAFHDAHTGLANRALFRDRLEHAVTRRGHHDVVVLFIDMDDFKLVNDTLGHDAGDHLLVLVAERLRACVRTSDTVARLGGDEFGVLIDDTDAMPRAEELASRILAAMEVPFTIGAHELRVRASIGVAFGVSGGATATALLQDADLAMYGAKRAGKATYMRFDPSLRAEAGKPVDMLRPVEPIRLVGGSTSD